MTMNKTEFLDALEGALGKLPSAEVEQSCAFYAEAIDDRVEEGMTQEAAVAALGDVGLIAAQIAAETPPIPKAIAKAKTGSRALDIVLLALLSPLWASLALAFALAVASVYLAIWLLIASLWLVVAILVLCAPAGLLCLIWCMAKGYPLSGAFLLGGGLASAGIGLFAWLGVTTLTKELAKLSHAFARRVKSLFVKLKRPRKAPSEPKGAVHA